jgi:hypothetical protein
VPFSFDEKLESDEDRQSRMQGKRHWRSIGCNAPDCARATIGHAAAPPRAAMNSRHRIHPSRKGGLGYRAWFIVLADDLVRLQIVPFRGL